MFLNSFHVVNFRCFGKIPPIPIHKLTVFIGENDAGKTAVLDALKILVTDDKPSRDDYRDLPGGQKAERITISGTFTLEEYDTLPEDYRTLDGRELKLTKIFTTEGAIDCQVAGRGFADTRWNTFDKQSASVQQELLQSIDVAPGSNKQTRIKQFQQAVEEGRLEKEATILEIKANQLDTYLPRFETVSATDYAHPDSIVRQTLRSVAYSVINPENPQTGERELLPELKTLQQHIKDVLDTKIEEMYETLQRENPRLLSVKANPAIDFSQCVGNINLMINSGEGPRLVGFFGEGTKKKLWMGLLEWQRQEAKGISTIRVYDEPDVNLDYTAERRLFSGILETTRNPSAHTQAVVCTHSVTLIDRTPSESVNLITVGGNGERTIERMETQEEDEGVREFLESVGRTVGLTNSAFFYERAFLIVEGESEENALPILYRNLYGHSCVEDGIVFINLYTCSAWKTVLSLFKRDKSPITFLLLDNDCKEEGSSGRVTPNALSEIGYPENFAQKNCFYIGKKEFEDAFSSEDITAVLNSHWPKRDAPPWTISDINQFRQDGQKFSKDLLNHVRKTCTKDRRGTAKKPEFAEKLALHCKNEDQVPDAIRSVLTELRICAGCNET